MQIRWRSAAGLTAAGALAAAVAATAAGPTTFRVQVENVSKPDTLRTSAGNVPAAVAPILWVVHSGKAMFFTPDAKDRGKGLESLAEDGDPKPLSRYLIDTPGVAAVGLTNVPVGSSGPGPIVSGGSYEFTVSATPGSRLSLAMMFGQSNDIFFASDAIELFTGGRPREGDITGTFALWDAGTEVNQEPGVGPDQAPRQKAPNTGETEHQPVRLLKSVADGFTYPAVADVIKVTITAVPAISTRR